VPWRHVGGRGNSATHVIWGARWRWVVRFMPQCPWQSVDTQKFCIILLLCTHDMAPPPPAAKVSGDKNVNMSDIAPCLATVHKCNNVVSAWPGSMGQWVLSVQQHLSSPHYRNHLLTVLMACCVLQVAVHSNSYWLHNTNFLSPHTAHFKLSVIHCSDNYVGNLNNNRAYRGDIKDVQSLSEENNPIVEIYLSWLLFYWSMG
jgi:hypothetical protein